jgi:hexosaminidase
MTYPRSWAIAEAVWSQAAQKNWPDFVRLTESHFDRADAANVLVSKALYDPMATTSVKAE